MADVLQQLLPCSWTGVNRPQIQFPTTTITMTMRHDLARHEYWGVDGSQIEATGRKSLEFQVMIPFRNGIVPGPTEKWGALYPYDYRQFIVATSDRATGIFVHPEFGQFSCKTDAVITHMTGQRRDGVDVEVTWVETLFPEDLSAIESTTSPVKNAELAALDLDANLTSLAALGAQYQLPIYKPDFFDTLNQIAAVTDQISLQSQRLVGKVDQVGYRLNIISDSVTRLQTPPRTSVASIINPNPTATNAAIATLCAPIRESIGIMQASLYAVKRKILENGQNIGLYRVPGPTSLGALIAATGASIIDLMSLNPAVVASPVVPTGSMIRYYINAKR